MTYRKERPVLITACAALLAFAARAHSVNGRECTVSFGIGLSETLASIQFSVDYSLVQGSFAGAGPQVACRSPIDGAWVFANDSCDGDYAMCQSGDDRTLVASVTHPHGFSGPTTLLRCTFESVADPAPEDFRLTLDGASAPTLDDVGKFKPAVEVTSVACREAQ